MAWHRRNDPVSSDGGGVPSESCGGDGGWQDEEWMRVVAKALRAKAALREGRMLECELLGRKALVAWGWVCGGRSTGREGSCGWEVMQGIWPRSWGGCAVVRRWVDSGVEQGIGSARADSSGGRG